MVEIVDKESVKAVTKKAKSKREPLRRPRGKRGGIKNRKDKSSTSVKLASKESKQNGKLTGMHAMQIAQFHTLEKQLAQAQDEKERAKILQQQQALGGLQAYQDASLFGSDKQRGGETGKWCAQQLMEIRGREKIRLLDVGALSGTAYAKYDWIDTISIDLNPRNNHVLQFDFFDYPIPSTDGFDVVALSLVVNFVGDLADRGRMLLHAHKYLSSNDGDGDGFLFLVLPLACVQNSRYCDHTRLRAILKSCGWGNVVRQHDSARLTHWLCKETSKDWDGKVWKKEEIKKGVSLNNFCIIVR